MWADNPEVYIKTASLESMSSVVDITDWVIAFLYGVFDEEVIPNLVIRKRKDSAPHVQEIDRSLVAFARGEPLNFFPRF